MMEGNLMVDDQNLSVLTTCASAGDQITRNETSADPLYSQHSSASTNQPPPPSSKRKRNLPGNPDPEAEVIALSPKSLLATNRFICEICNKGFQRDQNLQLHRRGHNLPWKLKQRGNKEVRKKVYVCPEATCVHHHPSRALGDLTGIKKHFCRKHGEKKWKCEKCSKRYAVKSDWKAHSKICGTREYRCDCGTLFSRRDSFITHRAFCDALAQGSTTVTSSFPASAVINNNSFPSFLRPNLFPLIKAEEGQGGQPFFSPDQLLPSSNNNNNNNPTLHSSSLENGHHHSLFLQQNPNPNPTSTPIGFGLAGLGSSPLVGSCTPAPDENPHLPLPLPLPPFFHHMMSFEEASFEEALNGILMNGANRDDGKGGGDGDDGETRDFLGLRALARSDHIFEVNDMSSLNSSSPFGLHQINHQTQSSFWRH